MRLIFWSTVELIQGNAQNGRKSVYRRSEIIRLNGLNGFSALTPYCTAGDFLVEFLKLCSRKESVDEILGKGSAEEESKGEFLELVGAKHFHLRFINAAYNSCGFSTCVVILDTSKPALHSDGGCLSRQRFELQM